MSITNSYFLWCLVENIIPELWERLSIMFLVTTNRFLFCDMTIQHPGSYPNMFTCQILRWWCCFIKLISVLLRCTGCLRHVTIQRFSLIRLKKTLYMFCITQMQIRVLPQPSYGKRPKCKCIGWVDCGAIYNPWLTILTTSSIMRSFGFLSLRAVIFPGIYSSL